MTSLWGTGGRPAATRSGSVDFPADSVNEALARIKPSNCAAACVCVIYMFGDWGGVCLGVVRLYPGESICYGVINTTYIAN